MASVMPKVRRRVSAISRRVRPFSSTRALGRASVSGRRRVPRPAAKIMAFMGEDSRSGEPPEKTRKKHLHLERRERRRHREEGRSFAEVLQSQVAENHLHAGFGAEAFG